MVSSSSLSNLQLNFVLYSAKINYSSLKCLSLKSATRSRHSLLPWNICNCHSGTISIYLFESSQRRELFKSVSGFQQRNYKIMYDKTIIIRNYLIIVSTIYHWWEISRVKTKYISYFYFLDAHALESDPKTYNKKQQL